MSTVLPALVAALRHWMRRANDIDADTEAAFRAVVKIQKKAKDIEVINACLGFTLNLITDDDGESAVLAPMVLKGF